MDELLEDLLGRLFGDLLDLDAAFLADHQHEPLARAIEDDAEVELALDLQPLLDQHALDDLPRRPGLVGDEVHAEDLLRGAERFVGALDDLDAAALAAAAGVDLRLDDDGAAAEPLRPPPVASAALKMTSPCGTGTPYFDRMAFA